MDGHGRPRYFSRARSKGRARLDWLENHKLTPDSNPVDFVNAMMKIDNSENGYTDTLFSKWTSWTNAKAILANMDRNSYGIIAPFTISEIIKHVALYILNGLNISPRVEYKFKSSTDDPVNGSDLCHAAFGTNAVKRHKVFKKVFAVQDPLLNIP